jgi:hypothetical protein
LAASSYFSAVLFQLKSGRTSAPRLPQADERPLNIGQPDIIRPAIAADRK